MLIVVDRAGNVHLPIIVIRVRVLAGNPDKIQAGSVGDLDGDSREADYDHITAPVMVQYIIHIFPELLTIGAMRDRWGSRWPDFN
jgi:hypothetical protein